MIQLLAFGIVINGAFAVPSAVLTRDLRLDRRTLADFIGFVVGTGITLGMALGGFGVDWAAKFDRRWFVWGPAIGLLIATPLFFFGAGQASILMAVLVLGLGHVALFVYYTPTLALAREMLHAAGLSHLDPAEALRDGRAMDTWRAMVRAQGGDPDAPLPKAAEVEVVRSTEDGRT